MSKQIQLIGSEMKKITQYEMTPACQISFNDNLNPEDNQHRCKICFEQKMPLVTLCQCTGSIAYVHQDCILDWIALKMEKSELIEIPKCQICKSKFSATMKIGLKKVDNSLLFEKLKKTDKKHCLMFFVSLVGFIVALATILFSVFNLILGSSLVFETVGSFIFSVVKTTFLGFVFPCVFMDGCLKYYKKKWKIIDDCKIQLVEVTLLPKKILKA